MFLFLQGKNFLPEYHKSLQIARASGIDLHDSIDKQYQLIKQFNGGFNRVYSTEYLYPGVNYDNLAKSHEELRREAYSDSRRDIAILRDLDKKIKEVEEAEAKAEAEAAKAASQPDEPAPIKEESEGDGPSLAEEFTKLENQVRVFNLEAESIPTEGATAEELTKKRQALLGSLYQARQAAAKFVVDTPSNSKKKSSSGKVTSKKLKDIRVELVKRIAMSVRESLKGIKRMDIIPARKISDENFQKIKEEIAALAGKTTIERS